MSLNEPTAAPAQDNSLSARLSRRSMILAGAVAGLFASIRPASAADNCNCLPAPDCTTICPNGGSPRGDGTQGCNCLETPIPPRALAATDGGDAVNAAAWAGKTLRLNHNTTDTRLLVFSSDGRYVDYVDKTEIMYTHPISGISPGSYNSVTVNAQGHVTRGSNINYVRTVNNTSPDSSGNVNVSASVQACSSSVMGGIRPSSSWTKVVNGSWQSDYSYTATENCFIVAWHSGGNNNQTVDAFINGTQVYHNFGHHNDGHNAWPMFFLLKGQTIRYTSNGAYFNIAKLKLQ